MRALTPGFLLASNPHIPPMFVLHRIIFLLQNRAPYLWGRRITTWMVTWMFFECCWLISCSSSPSIRSLPSSLSGFPCALNLAYPAPLVPHLQQSQPVAGSSPLGEVLECNRLSGSGDALSLSRPEQGKERECRKEQLTTYPTP